MKPWVGGFKTSKDKDICAYIERICVFSVLAGWTGHPSLKNNPQPVPMFFYEIRSHNQFCSILSVKYLRLVPRKHLEGAGSHPIVGVLLQNYISAAGEAVMWSQCRLSDYSIILFMGK